MKDTITILRDNINKLTEAQRKVGNYILRNPSEVAFLTVDQLALKVGTSTTTVMRLANYLGYSGYTELQKGLQTILRNYAAPHSRLESNLQEVNPDNLWISTINHHIEHIQSINQMIPKETIDKALDIILSANRIYCTSVRSGLPVGQYLSLGLNRSMGNCQLIEADSSYWVDEVISFTSNDVVIATSFPRYARGVIDFVKTAKEYGAQVISITDSYSSPIVSYSDITLPCDSSSIAFHNSPIPAMVVADYLVSAVAITNSEEIKDRLDRLNSVLTNINYHQRN